jgi:hypothetical protein
MATSSGKELAKRYKIAAVIVGNTIQSSSDHNCGVCFKGVLHAKPLTLCTLKCASGICNDETMYICHVCMKRAFKVDASTMDQCMRTHRRRMNTRSYDGVLMMSASVDHQLHPLVSRFYTYLNRGDSIAPNFVKDVMRVLLVYHRDRALFDNYVWIVRHISHVSGLEGMRTKFEGVHGVWPTMAERQRVDEIRRTHTDCILDGAPVSSSREESDS